MIDEGKIYSIEGPSPRLLKLYVIRSILSGPFIFFSLPVFLFRFYTLRYRFDKEGIGMKWGFIFRKEINLTYSRIQDIHLTSGLIQRWLSLADIKIQTASGSAEPEMTLEGIIEYELLRDFLYTRMRGYREHVVQKNPCSQSHTAGQGAELITVLMEIKDELKATREALEKVSERNR